MFTVFKNFRVFLYVLFEFTSIGFVKEKIRIATRGKAFRALDLSGIKRYLNANELESGESGVKRRVLVDMLLEYPSCNFNANLICLFLKKRYGATGVALTQYGSSSVVYPIAEAFGIRQFAGIYRFFDISNHFYSAKAALLYLLRAKYDPAAGYSLKIDGQEVGHLIYDEYIRITGKPTVQKLDWLYALVVYNSLYRYLRYKEVISANRITDVVMSHIVYARFGLVIKAAAAVDDNIRIWVPSWIKPVAISCNRASKDIINNLRFYRSRYFSEIVNTFDRDELERQFDSLFNLRISGRDSGRWDAALTYNNQDINTVEDFVRAYPGPVPCIFIMAHVFIDAVRSPHWQLFSDSYVWLRETLIALAKKSTQEPIYVKPHPAESAYGPSASTGALVGEINREYAGRFILLDKKVNTAIVYKMAKAFITSHGSIGSEAPCLGIPVITAASCEYEEAGAIHQAKSVAEYVQLLNNIDSLPELSEHAIFNAKVSFLWYHKYSLVDSELLPKISIFPDAKLEESWQCINETLGHADSLEDDPVYCGFCDMIENNKNDMFNIR